MKLHSASMIGLALVAGIALAAPLSQHDTVTQSAPALSAPAAVAATPVESFECAAAAEALDYTPDPQAKNPGDCSFKSDCNGAKCCKGRCAWASGSCCSFDSDCGFKGAKCRGGKCSNAPDGKCSFSSECPSGKCSSGKCKK